MLEPSQFKEAAEAAHEQFGRFVEFVGEKSLRELWSLPATDDKKKIMRLIAFMIAKHKCPVYGFGTAFPHSLPRKQYGSWLFKVDRGIMIAIDRATLDGWSIAHKWPVSIQITRSILHELGHLLLSKDLMSVPPLHFTTSATAKQEEIAWVFALTFLACVAGHYALNSRTDADKDDATCFVV